MPHLDEGTLTALFDGELARDERELAERHVADCGDCRRLYDEIRAFAGEAGTLVDSLQPQRLPLQARSPMAGRPAWDRFRPFAWAATLVLAVGLGWSASARRFAQSPADSSTAEVAEQLPTATSVLSGDQRAVEPSLEKRAPAGLREDEASRQQLTQPPTSAVAGAVKAVAPTPPAETDQVLANQASRAESAAPGAPSAQALSAQPRQARAADLAAPRDAPATAGRYRVAPLEEAVRALGGTVKLIDGLSPMRVQVGTAERTGGGAAGESVRIIYLDPPGRELWLDQQRTQAPAEAREGPAIIGNLLAGDTVVSAAGGGLSRVRWMSPDGFRLTLTGYLPGDSLRALVRRVH